MGILLDKWERREQRMNALSKWWASVCPHWSFNEHFRLFNYNNTLSMYFVQCNWCDLNEDIPNERLQRRIK